MDQRPRYTYFPNLFDSIKSKHAQATLETDWPISRLPQELLIHSWATLLRSYTGITEPVFLLEGTAVQVDLARNSWNEVEVDGTKLEDGHHTSIALNKVGFWGDTPSRVELILPSRWESPRLPSP